MRDKCPIMGRPFWKILNDIVKNLLAMQETRV